MEKNINANCEANGKKYKISRYARNDKMSIKAKLCGKDKILHL